ncbi:MAG: hypothetical protein RIC55_07110 [Pirellulaceae bacterium]
MLAVVAATGCKLNNAPPAARMMHPGPGVDGPGPGVLPPPMMPDFGFMPAPAVQVLFAKPEAMQVRWDVGGINQFDSMPLVVPGRTDFPMGGVYRLKLTSIERRVGVELYPTLEVAPVTPRSAAYLEHNAIPIQFTAEDFDQVLAGNFVTKVIYLPDPEFQELALAGVETLVSTRLDPGVDPIVEADRRGAILAIVRIGNKDLQMPQYLGDEGSVVVPAGHQAMEGQQQPAPTGQGYSPSAAVEGEQGGDASGQEGGEEAMQVQYGAPYGAPYGGNVYGGYPGYAAPVQVAAGGTTVPRYIAGVTTPPWGMTTSGTPIGLPGPPHIPHGIPAGLKKHQMRNWTPHFLPQPTKHIHIGVRQSPGFSYPRPANNMWVHERTRHLMPHFRQPAYDRVQLIRDGTGGGGYGGGAGGGYCPDCQ